MIHDSIGHLKMLCMGVLSQSGGIESECKHHSSSFSTLKKMLSVFKYESSLKLIF